MNIQKDIMASLTYPYAINIFSGEERRIFVGPEKKGDCIHFPLHEGGAPDVQNVWEGEVLGGTTGIAQLPGKSDEFLAIEGFYKGLQCEGAGIVHVKRREDGSWRVRRVLNLPFAHRIAAIRVEDAIFVVVGSLCAGKADRDDWSQPGRMYLGRWQESDMQWFVPIGEPIHQNHGMFAGRRDGRRVVLAAGRDGVFEIVVPERAGGDWLWRKILDLPVGDVYAYDLDGDGIDELIAAKDFHGNEIAIYKKENETWTEVYSIPVSYAHFVWAGTVLGKPAVIAGYRRSNAALVLLTKHPDAWRFEVEVIDQHEAPVNMEVFQENGTTQLFTTSEYTHRVVRYTLRE